MADDRKFRKLNRAEQRNPHKIQDSNRVKAVNNKVKQMSKEAKTDGDKAVVEASKSLNYQHRRGWN